MSLPTSLILAIVVTADGLCLAAGRRAFCLAGEPASLAGEPA